MNITETLMALSNVTGVCGDENEASQLALSMLKKYIPNAYIKNGNVIGHIGSGQPHILLDAHIDQIGLIVTFITDDGFIKVGNCGGVDRRLLLAQQVTIHGTNGQLTGVITSTPPHLSGADSNKAVIDITDVYIDTGFDKSTVEKSVNLGDKITFFAPCTELLNGQVTGCALDDRAGVTAILYALDLLAGKQPECKVSVIFSTQEELGCRGAKIAAYDINPDIAIAVDVSFALTSDDDPFKCGIMGKGGMIGVSPTLDKGLSNKLIKFAKQEDIPYQVEVMPGTTSTNADRFSVSRSGIKASTVSIPLKYMHTPVEIVDVKDIENVSKLLKLIMEDK